MYNNGKTVPGKYPMSYCLNQLEGYGTVRKSNKESFNLEKNWESFG